MRLHAARWSGSAFARLNSAAALDETPRQFFGRPFRVLFAGRFSQAILAQIRDAAVRRIAARPEIGSIDLFSDNTDLLEPVEWREKLRRLYS